MKHFHTTRSIMGMSLILFLALLTVFGCGDSNNMIRPDVDEEDMPSQASVPSAPQLLLPTYTIPTLKLAGTFDFNDGTTQGWTLEGAYDENGNGPLPSNFFFGWHDYVNYPNTPGRDAVGDKKGSIVMGTGHGHGVGNAGATWWIMRFRSPNLSSQKAWQSASGYSVRIAESMAALGGTLYANLYVVVYDLDQKQVRQFFNGPAQRLQHAAYGQNVWNTLRFDWSRITNFPSNYKVESIFVNIWGRMGDAVEGGVYLDEVEPTLLLYSGRKTQKSRRCSLFQGHQRLSLCR